MKKSNKAYWFHARQYGFGWYPSNWKGWLITIAYILLEAFTFKAIDKNSHSVSDTLRPFIILSIIYTLILFFICYKTCERNNF